MDNRVRSLMDFLDASPSVFHAVANLGKTLNDAGYTYLPESADWNLVPGGKYYTTRGGAAVIAFRIPENSPKGFMLSASHADRPCFKVKENAELTGKYTRLAVERYGGMLMAPWLDRPLSVAGRVMVETENGVETKLINLDRDLLLIPNVAIHMNRSANDGYKWNPAVDLLPLMGGKDAAGKFFALVEEAAGGKVLGHDLYLYTRQKAAVWGLEEEYVSSAALDDLACAWGCTQGFLKAEKSEAIPVLCVFDSEEVGSSSLQGADSDLLTHVLQRICCALGLNLARMQSQSLMISADNAHAASQPSRICRCQQRPRRQRRPGAEVQRQPALHHRRRFRCPVPQDLRQGRGAGTDLLQPCGPGRRLHPGQHLRDPRFRAVG